MSLKSRYKTLYKVSFTEPVDEFDINPSAETKTAFKGLIQAPSNGNTFNNGKDTTFNAGILFTDVKVVISEKDLIEDVNGTRYIVSASGSQPNGVTGIKPKRGQHSEYSLTYANKGL